MKKILAIILTLALMLPLSACGIVTIDNEDETTTVEKGDTDKDDTEEQTPEDETTKETEAEIVAFEEITVVDNDECTVKITGIDEDNFWGYTLKVYLENKSTDKTYMFSVDNAAVNGVQTDPFFAVEVAPGKKANEDMSFTDTTLEELGIKEFTDIEVSFRVYDSEDWLAEPVAVETIHVYPYGEDKATKFVREAQSTDNVIVDNDYVTAIVTEIDEEGFYGYTVNLFLVNKTDKEIMFGVENVSVNGFMLDPFWATSVTGGKCAFSSISWFETDFEDNGITEVEEIEMQFSAYDSEDWETEDYVNETIKLNP